MRALATMDRVWMTIASFSDMPICSVFAVVVMMAAIWPGGVVCQVVTLGVQGEP